MTELSNIADFKIQLAKVVANLFAAFPNRGAIKEGEVSESCIRWLLDEGIVRGEIQQPLSGPITLYNAQLTGHALSILQKPEQNAGGQILGSLVVRAMAEENDRDCQVVSDILGRRLLNI